MKDGIVTITSPITYSNLTLSGYQVNQEVTENILLDFYKTNSEDYIQLSELKTGTSNKKLYIVGEFKKDNINWIWWAFSFSNQIILASLNSEDELSEEDINLYAFMLDKMEIYPNGASEE